MSLLHPPASRWARLLSILLSGALLTACGGDSTGSGKQPDGEPGITITAGANVTDTVDAPLPVPLRVVVRDAAGRVRPGVVVRFTSVPVTVAGGTTLPGVRIGSVGASGTAAFYADTTSADGVALARVVMGQAAGAGAVLVALPEAGLQDTARFTIAPGAPVRLVLPVADTTIQVGRPLPLGGRVEDRYGNVRPDAITYAATGAGLTLAGGQVSAAVPARAAVTGRLEGSSLPPDTTWVSVVPGATIAARVGSRLVTALLDGTGVVPIPHPFEAGDPEWHPDGKSLLALLGDPLSLYRVELNGSAQHIISPITLSVNGFSVPGAIRGFGYSPDAQSVYLAGANCNDNGILYRFPVANARAIERLSAASANSCFEVLQQWPSLSPDGARLAYENHTGYQVGHSIRVLTIASGTVTELAVGGQRPRWSPAGDLVAFWANRQIWVVRPDGTGARAVSPAGHSYLQGVQWSPDGQWIIARYEPRQGWAGTTVALLNVSSGLEIPLPWTTGFGGIVLPAWKPVP